MMAYIVMSISSEIRLKAMEKPPESTLVEVPIQINNRIYPTVLDQDADQVLQLRLPFVLSLILKQRWKAMVTEHITLQYCYETISAEAEGKVWSLNPMT
jgi:hypothetical protein